MPKKRELNNKQKALIQIAAKEVGLRGKGFRGRYDLQLGQYKQSDDTKVTSCKQLTREQFEDFLAICESLGFRHQGKPANHYRLKAQQRGEFISCGQLLAIDHLKGDLGWDLEHLQNFIKKMTQGRTIQVAALTLKEASAIIEALKAILSKETGKRYTNLNEIKDDFSEATDGKKNQAG